MDQKTRTPEPVKKKRKKRKFRPWKVFLRVFLLLMLIGLGAAAGGSWYIISSLPPWDPDKLTGANSTLIYDQDGELAITIFGSENRIDASLNEVPEDMIQAFISTEDRRFYQHHGISLRGMARSALSNFSSGELGQGASTITQQLARQSFLTLEKSYVRKFKEIFLAFRIESYFSKDEILTMYLNKINFGSGAYGAKAAAHVFFNKELEELDLAEASFLAGLVQYPGGYDPFTHFDNAKQRHRTVLNNMVVTGYLTQSQADAAYNEELVIASRGGGSGAVTSQYGFYRDAVIEEAIKVLKQNGFNNPEDAIYNEGLRIYTGLNTTVQTQLETNYADPANFPSQQQNGKSIESAMVVLDNDKRSVVALIGGREYTTQRGFNRATSAYRQPGSSIKPLTVYSPALELGYMPYTVLEDKPISFANASGTWEPKNYDLAYRGFITMRTAVQYSVNTYAVQLLDMVGVRTGFDYGRAFGLSLTDRPGTNDLSLAPLSLGGLTDGVSPLEMTGAYATIANQGVYVEPHLIERIETSRGAAIYEFKPVYTRVIREDTAWLMTSMLQTVVASGTGTRAAISGIPMGGKTGTTDDLTNAWFCGITPRFTAAVWMGYDDQNKPMYNVAGGDVPARLFKSAVQKAYEGVTPGSFAMPGNIVSVSVCSKDGLLPDVLTPESAIVSDFAAKEFVPTEYSSAYKPALVCSETGDLASLYCPEPVSRLFLDLPDTLDAERMPEQTCTLHTAFNQGPAMNPGLDNPDFTGNEGSSYPGYPNYPGNTSNYPGSAGDLPDINVPNPDPADTANPVYDPDTVFDLNDIKV
jgi:penicillin-binding protein 1A